MRASTVFTTDQRHRLALALTFAAPLVAALAVILTSPNYRVGDPTEVRAGPIGGDFLQEWIGGRIVAGGRSAELYDNRLSQSLQHDAELLGYRWSASEYYPMVYPPFYYALLSRFSRLSPATAATLWCLLNGVAFALGLAMLAHQFRERLGSWIWSFPAAALFFPLLLSLNMGQKAGFLLLILESTYVLLQRGREFSSGLVFGLIVFKPHLGLVLGVAMLLSRRFRFVAGASIPVVTAAGWSLAVSAKACAQFLQVCAGAATYANHPGYALSETHNLWGAAKLALGESSPGLVLPLVAISALLVVWWLWRSLRAGLDFRSNEFALQYSALIVGTILLSPHFFTYDLAILLIPMVLVGGVCLDRGGRACVAEGPRATCRRVIHIGIIGILFVASGCFGRFASAGGISISVVLLAVWLATLTRDLDSARPLATHGLRNLLPRAEPH